MAQDGTLTVAADQAVGKLTVKATAVKDIASSDDTDANKVVGTFEVNVIAEKSFQVVAATVENGKVAFKVGDTENATSFKAVSYTHLDVYKRQEQYNLLMF